MSECVYEGLQRRVLTSRVKPTELTISEGEARTLSEELAAMRPFASDPDKAEIFAGMLRGDVRFMGIAIKVTPAPSGIEPGCLNRYLPRR